MGKKHRKLKAVPDDGEPEMHVNQIESGDVAISITRNLGGKCGFCGEKVGWLMVFGLKDRETPKDMWLCPTHFNDYLSVALQFWLKVRQGKMRDIVSMEVVPKNVAEFIANGSKEVSWTEASCG